MLTYSYDAEGRITRRDDNRGGVTSYVFDALGRRTSIYLFGTAAASLQEDRAYDARGALTTVTRFNNTNGTTWRGTSRYAYDSMGRLTTLTHSTMTLTMLTVTYGYDAESRVILETADGSATTYVYDAENQLTTAGTETYSYDASGNRNSTGYVVSTGNRVTNDGVWTYTYDVEGQLTKKSKGASQETWSYSYDERGLMTAASKANTDGCIEVRKASGER